MQILQQLSKTSTANSHFINWYNLENNRNLNSIIDVFQLLGYNQNDGTYNKNDVRLYYGVFLDYFASRGVFINVNNTNFSVYITELNECYKYREMLCHEAHGFYYIALNGSKNEEIPKQFTHLPMQYYMFQAIVTVMSWLNIELNE